MRDAPNPLIASHELGLLPLVKKLQFLSYESQGPWMRPKVFDSGGLRHFFALVNLQDLVIMDLDLDLSKFFSHFSPMLRSITLLRPIGSPQQLLDFLKLFPKLDDIKIIRFIGMAETQDAPGTQRTHIQGSLRGKLALDGIRDQWLLEEIIESFGGMRFVSMELNDVVGVQLLLDACAEMLQTLCFLPGNRLYRSKFLKEYGMTSALTELGVGPPPSPQNLDLSRNKVLRSLEVRDLIIFQPEFKCALRQFLPTITSPVFSEIVVVSPDEPRKLCGMAQALRQLYEIRRFCLAFCLETADQSGVGNLQALEIAIRNKVTQGSYDFLPRPPVVFACTLTKYDRLMTSGLMYNVMY